MAQKFRGVELLRFACALTIVVWHYQHFFLLTDVTGLHIAGWSPERQPFYSLLYAPYTYGSYAVNAFWIISGFIFFWKYADAINRGEMPWYKFFVLRFSRLYPLHILTLLLVAALQFGFYRINGFYAVYSGNDLYHFFLNVFMASGWGFDRGLFSFNAPVWSVSAEEIVYALFFFGALSARLTLLRCVVIAVACYLATRSVHRIGLPDAIFILSCGQYFFIGGALHLTFKKMNLRPVQFWQRLGALPETMGNLTYSSYLLHFPVMLVFIMGTDALGWPRDVYYDWRLWLAYIVTVFSLAHAAFIWIERPSRDALRTISLSRTSLVRP